MKMKGIRCTWNLSISEDKLLTTDINSSILHSWVSEKKFSSSNHCCLWINFSTNFCPCNFCSTFNDASKWTSSALSRDFFISEPKTHMPYACHYSYYVNFLGGLGSNKETLYPDFILVKWAIVCYNRWLNGQAISSL